MNAKFVNLYLAAISLCFGHCTGLEGTLFSSTGDYGKALRLPHDMRGARAESRAICAIICHKDKSCAAFHYMETSKICILTKGEEGVPSVLMYRPVFGKNKNSCPHGSGYKIYVRKKMIFCFKYYYDSVTKLVADDMCSVDGARLVTIEDKSMFEFVRDILIYNDWENPTVWIDAFDVNRSGKFLTSQNQTLPYTPPGSDLDGRDSSGGHQRCVRIYSTKNFEDTNCDEPLRPLCQIHV